MSEANELPAGRELDALIASKVMGWPIVEGRTNDNGVISPCWTSYRDDVSLRPIPEYSADIAAAWQVVEKIAHNVKLTKYHRNGEPLFECVIDRIALSQMVSEIADTAPIAICRAALKAAAASEAAR